MVPFGRILKLGSIGQDCTAVKRALARAGHGDLKSPGVRSRLFGPFAVKNLQAFCGSKVYDAKAHAKLRPYFDLFSDSLYEGYKSVDPALVTARAMLSFCRRFDNTYVWGGEHDATLVDDNPHDGFDCSSSTSYLLYHFGLLHDGVAHVAEWFEFWGVAGRGKYVTVHATYDHVWTEFDLPEGWFRFDTSPHGDGGLGPRVREKKRDTSRFVSRHPSGL